MALSTRAKTLAWVLTVVVLAGVAFVGYRLLTKQPNEPLVSLPFVEQPVLCPLTGEEARNERLAGRRALAVKIENSASARPQAGLEAADLVYEQEAEGGITRFIAVYHCQDTGRLGPIRSARPVDPLVLEQYGDVLFVHAGSVPAVINALERAGIEDINCNFQEAVCPRDPAKIAPHDVFTGTSDLYRFGGRQGEPPPAIFTFSDDELPRQGTRRGREVRLDFSAATDVLWRYDRAEGGYLRFHGEDAHTLEDGTQVSAPNVVVQVVDRKETRLTDSAGNPVPSYDVVGSGEAYVLRDGRVVEGRWQRRSVEEPTTFVDRRGDPIPLAPGQTWIELFPSDAEGPVEIS